MPFELLPIVEGGDSHPCGCCSPSRTQLCKDSRIAVGFGDARLTKDGETVWQESGHEWDECMTVEEAEEIARLDPDHDWRIVLHGPLRGATYQRQGDMAWLMVEKNEGFA